MPATLERQVNIMNTDVDLGSLSNLKTTYINNRRYLGNKYKLLSFITSVVSDNCKNINSIADIFAGTGAVASAFIDKQIITNDNMYSNYISHIAWFSPQEYSRTKIETFISQYNNTYVLDNNYMSDNFANTFFSIDDCRRIGFIREDIEVKYSTGRINERERALLITSLLYAADKIANTCGHYDAFRQGVNFDKSLELSIPIPAEYLNPNNKCYNIDTNDLVQHISADLVYIDPPYNSRQYCDAYHLLENIARWNKPDVIGVARKMDRSNLKSDYCTSRATVAFENLINNINAKYILLSYNNMAQKGNDRSNAKINDDDIMRILSEKGDVKVFTHDYKAFSTGKSYINEHEERLFLCSCEPITKPNVQSPLNYTGGKFRLLEQILPHFPGKIDTFVDMFCGGCNVGINVNAKKVIFCDNNTHLLNLYRTFKKLGSTQIFKAVDRIIKDYGLSSSTTEGYDYYGCNSSDGLSSFNRAPFLKLRNDFNHKTEDSNYYLMLYVLIIFAFNNQIRFNSKGEFNLPVGKRDFNERMRTKLHTFIDRLQRNEHLFLCEDFRNISKIKLDINSLVYCDPPYLITCATYNEQGGWNEQCERDLLNKLDELDSQKIKFALSNVLSNKGKTNNILKKWLSQRDYRVIHLNYSYSNSNYHTKDKSSTADEVLIVNY